MPAAATAPAASSSTPKGVAQKPIERKYKCTYCARAFSRSEHRSRHERSRKFFRFLSPVNGGVVHGGVVKAPLPTFADSPLAPQIPKNALSNAQNVEALLCDETCCYDMTAPFTPKMEESRSSARSRGGRAQRLRPRRLRQSHRLAWTRQHWNK